MTFTSHRLGVWLLRAGEEQELGARCCLVTRQAEV